MQRIIIFLIINYFMSFGCSSSGENFKTFYYQENIVFDRGGNNVLVVGKACSIFPNKAIIAAKKSAEYNLRNVIGNNRYIKKLKKIRQYYEGQKTCVEILAKGSDIL